MIGKGLFADDPAAMQAQKLQHLIFLIDQNKRAPLNASLSRAQIQQQIAKFQHILAMSTGIALQHLESGDQFFQMQGLGEIIVRLKIPAGQPCLNVGLTL